MARAEFNTLIIPYRLNYNQPEFAVFYRSEPKMCQFIAGGGEDDESIFEAAKRETFEEAAIQLPDEKWLELDSKASLPRSAFPNALWPDNVYVITEHCFAVHVSGAEIKLSKEHFKFKWLTFEQAFSELSWDSNRVALFELNCRLKDSNSTVSIKSNCI